MPPLFPASNSPYRFWKDPLDKFLIALFTTGIVSTALGYWIHFLIIVATIAVVLKLNAPNKKFKTAEEVSDGVDLSDKVVMVTGPTSGIGTETARILALRGARVILVSRNVNKLIKTKMQLTKRVPGAEFYFIQCDLNDQVSIRKCAMDFLKMKLPLHIFIGNAGLMALQERQETMQGLERQVGVNHVGHYLLLKLLTEKLIESAPARVVMLSSAAHKFFSSQVLRHERLETVPYEAWRAYGNSKMMNSMVARYYNEKFSGSGITAVCCSPGGIMTGLQVNVESWIRFKWFLVRSFLFKSIEQGAATTVYCATHLDVLNHGGEYFENCKVAKLKSRVIPDIAACTALCNTTETLIV